MAASEIAQSWPRSGVPPEADLVILSWNILAPCWADPVRYSHVPPQSLDWTARFEKIVDHIAKSSADIVCLQEVEFALFEDDVFPTMVSIGYAGHIQQDPKRNKDHPAGNATFWKEDKFKMDQELSRSRTLTTVLTDSSQRRLGVVNCHLEGDPMQATTRVKQLQTSLKQASPLHLQGLVIAGDLNCDLRSSASAAYLAFGHVPSGGILEWGREVPSSASEIPPHGFNLASAYPPDIPGDFTFTMRGNGLWLLDQLWHSPESLHLRGFRRIFDDNDNNNNNNDNDNNNNNNNNNDSADSSNNNSSSIGAEVGAVGENHHRGRIVACGLPGEADPSDHLPIAAAFSWSGPSPAELVGSDTNGGQNGGGGGGKSQSSSGGGDVGGDSTSLQREAEELLAAAPITEEQRQSWLANAFDLPSKPAGKPSPEALKAIKEQQRQREALLAEVGEEAKSMLLRAQQLHKKARKAAASEAAAAAAAAASGTGGDGRGRGGTGTPAGDASAAG